MKYEASSVKTLDYFEHIRQYPGVYIGGKDIRGLHHCAKELISNSIDEFLNDACSKIIIKLQMDGGFYIKDNGRGIPHGKHESGCSILQACAGIANTGGKFNNATGQTGYNSSGGEHGVGLKAVNALSRKMIVSTSRDGKKEIIEFSKGKFISSKEEKSTETGVEVLFYPDDTIFETVVFDSEKLQTMIQEFSYLCSGLTFHFVDEIKGINKEFLSDNGLSDYINFLSQGKKLIAKPIYFNEREGMYQVEVALAYSDSYSSTVKLYTNNIPQEKGTHLTGFKTALTSTFNAFAREKNWIKEKDSNLTGSDLEEGQILIINFKMIDPVFKGQNKEELSSSEGRTYVQKLSASALKEYFAFHEKEVKQIADKALNARKAREAAKKARDSARNVNKSNKKSLLDLPTKLIDCWRKKDRISCELFVVEGDSAANSLVKGRDSEFQAIFPVRGKMISAYKNSNDKVFANQEINNLIKAIGLEVDIKTGKLIYDAKKLRYGKIIAAADADPDGKSIKNLLFTDIWWLCPELIMNGHVYAAIPPLYRITTKKNKYIFLKDDKELSDYKGQHQGEKYLVSRNKGLGEQDSEELEESILNPETRNVIQITVEDINKTAELFEILMGPNVPPRREYLLAHSEEAEDFISENQIDITKELSQNFIDFSYEANSQRAFADARDGLKPGQRACLWEMYINGHASNKPHVKSAKIDGGVAARWWPHGTTAIYETFARMSQDWINNIPEVDWHGGNGSIVISGEPSADRYTEARLSKATEDGLLNGIKKQNVPMIPNFSEDAEWSSVLPAIMPRLMVNGCQGIGV